MNGVTWRPWIVLLGIAMLVVLLPGCRKAPETVQPPIEDVLPPGGELTPGAVSGEPLKIGAIFAITGAASSLGEPEANTAKMLEEQINAEGGINGRPLQIIIRDTKGEESEALTATRELIDKENVLALVGPSRSGTTMALIETVEQAGVPLISCAAARAITDPVKKWVFSTPQSDQDAVYRIFEYLQAKGIKKIAAITASGSFGDEGLKQMEAQAPAAGIKIVAREQFADNDTDMTTQLTRIKGTDAETVICWGVGPAPALIAKNMQQLAMQIPLVMSHGVANRRFIEGAGDAANGIVLPAGKLLVAAQLPDDDPHKPLLLQYATQYQDKFGKPADTFGGHAWDGIMLVVKAMREGALDRAAIRDAIEKTQGFMGIGGTFNFSPESHYGLNPDAFALVEIVDGDWKLISE
ncbi:MAG: ABC transporter substrate-binding protein [Armatimonadota bacterium]